jgi:hypothetical protein
VNLKTLIFKKIYWECNLFNEIKEKNGKKSTIKRFQHNFPGIETRNLGNLIGFVSLFIGTHAFFDMHKLNSKISKDILIIFTVSIFYTQF